VTLPVNNPNVVLVEEDAPRYLMGETEQTIPYGIESVQAPAVWNKGYDGSDITVCIIDSGLYTEHEDMVGVDVVDGYDNPKARTGPWYEDYCGHGTHVAGTVAAVDNEIGVVGVAPGVSLFIVKVFGDVVNGPTAPHWLTPPIAAPMPAPTSSA